MKKLNKIKKLKKQKGGELSPSPSPSQTYPLPIGQLKAYTPSTMTTLDYSNNDLCILVQNLEKAHNLDSTKFNDLVTRIVWAIFPQVYPLNLPKYWNQIIQTNAFNQSNTFYINANGSFYLTNAVPTITPNYWTDLLFYVAILLNNNYLSTPPAPAAACGDFTTIMTNLTNPNYFPDPSDPSITSAIIYAASDAAINDYICLKTADNTTLENLSSTINGANWATTQSVIIALITQHPLYYLSYLDALDTTPASGLSTTDKQNGTIAYLKLKNLPSEILAYLTTQLSTPTNWTSLINKIQGLFIYPAPGPMPFLGGGKLIGGDISPSPASSPSPSSLLSFTGISDIIVYISNNYRAAAQQVKNDLRFQFISKYLNLYPLYAFTAKQYIATNLSAKPTFSTGSPYIIDPVYNFTGFNFVKIYPNTLGHQQYQKLPSLPDGIDPTDTTQVWQVSNATDIAIALTHIDPPDSTTPSDNNAPAPSLACPPQQAIPPPFLAATMLGDLIKEPYTIPDSDKADYTYWYNTLMGLTSDVQNSLAISVGYADWPNFYNAFIPLIPFVITSSSPAPSPST